MPARPLEPLDVGTKVFCLVIIRDDPHGNSSISRFDDTVADPVIGDREHANVDRLSCAFEQSGDGAPTLVSRTEEDFGAVAFRS